MLIEVCTNPETTSKSKYKMPYHEFCLCHNHYRLDQLTGFLRTWLAIASECYKYIPEIVKDTNEDSGYSAILQRGFNFDSKTIMVPKEIPGQVPGAKLARP